MNREEKLKYLKKPETKLALIASDDFSDVLDDKIKQLKETLGQRVELDTEDLFEQLDVLAQFQNEVKTLKEAIKTFDFPGSVSVEGLEALVDATKALASANKVTKNIEKLQHTFDAVYKAVTDDIYARYDWSNSGNSPSGQFIGYLAQTGSWFIQKIGESANGDKSSTFAAGLNDYKQNWAVKEKLKYQPRDKVTIA